MYEFDALTRDSKEMNLAELNSAAIVNYEGSGILQANISPDESYIMIVASRNPGNTECGLYQLSAENKALAVIDRGKITFDNGKVYYGEGHDDDAPVQREEPRVKVTEQIQPKVDVVKQPTVPTEIKISPQIAPVTTKKDKKDKKDD